LLGVLGQANNKSPFVITVYYGVTKPNNPNEVFKDGEKYFLKLHLE